MFHKRNPHLRPFTLPKFLFLFELPLRGHDQKHLTISHLSPSLIYIFPKLKFWGVTYLKKY